MILLCKSIKLAVFWEKYVSISAFLSTDMSSIVRLEGEELAHSLRQIVLSTRPLVDHDSTPEALEEHILHLEETDPNFHR